MDLCKLRLKVALAKLIFKPPLNGLLREVMANHRPDQPDSAKLHGLSGS